jgi:hypothetical protein
VVSTHKGESISRREKEKKERRQLEAERIRALGTRRLEEDASRIVNLPFNEREAGLIYTCKKSVLLGVEPISNLSTKKCEPISTSGSHYQRCDLRKCLATPHDATPELTIDT